MHFCLSDIDQDAKYETNCVSGSFTVGEGEPLRPMVEAVSVDKNLLINIFDCTFHMKTTRTISLFQNDKPV